MNGIACGVIGVIGVVMLAGGVSLAQGQEPPRCGLQRAEVVNDLDSMGRNRLSIRLPADGSQAVWAERVYPKKPLKAPAAAIGDQVFVLFEDCNPARPVVVGFARP